MDNKSFPHGLPISAAIFLCAAMLFAGCKSTYNVNTTGFGVTANMVALGEVSVTKEGTRAFPFISNQPVNGVLYAELLQVAKETYGEEAVSVINIYIDAKITNYFFAAKQIYTATGTAVKIITEQAKPAEQ